MPRHTANFAAKVFIACALLCAMTLALCSCDIICPPPAKGGEVEAFQFLLLLEDQQHSVVNTDAADEAIKWANPADERKKNWPNGIRFYVSRSHTTCRACAIIERSVFSDARVQELLGASPWVLTDSRQWAYYRNEARKLARGKDQPAPAGPPFILEFGPGGTFTRVIYPVPQNPDDFLKLFEEEKK